jgi:hypothetical protein
MAPTLVVVVVDVASPAVTTEAIRAGASDMVLCESPDAVLPARVARLVKRQGWR